MYVSDLCRLIAQPDAEPFREPVDWRRDRLWDYPRIVTTPMDLGTCLRKLEEDHYSSGPDLRADLDLIFDNAVLYNGQGSWIWTYVVSMRKAVNDMFPFASASAAASASAPPRSGCESLRVARAWLTIPGQDYLLPDNSFGTYYTRVIILLPISLMTRSRDLYVHLHPRSRFQRAAHSAWYRVDTSAYGHTGARYADVAKAVPVAGANIAYSNGSTGPVCEVALDVPTRIPIDRMIVTWSTDHEYDDRLMSSTCAPRKAASTATGNERSRNFWLERSYGEGYMRWVSVRPVDQTRASQLQAHWHLDASAMF